MATAARYRFGPFFLDGASFRLMQGDAPLAASPKVIDLLLYLCARPSTLVSKDELFRALWPDVAVTDNALTQVISELRQTLGDDPAKPRFVQTVARRGYRFIAAVEAVAPASAGAGVQANAPAAVGAAPAVGVLDFDNVSGDAAFGWLSSGIAETVTNDLRAATLRVIDRVRVVEATARVGRDLPQLRTTLGLDLVVVGSFQRAGDRLRITARVVDAATGEARADAKADGALEQVFELQDRVVTQLAGALGTAKGSAAHHPRHRE